MAPVIRRAYELGCLFDAWSEQFNDDKWQQAFRDCGVDPDFYTLRERPEDELFPWDFIDIGVTKRFLRREWDRAMEGVVTPNCLEQCSGCGAGSYGCGICPTNRNPQEQAARGVRGAAGKKTSQGSEQAAAAEEAAGEVTT